MFVLWVSCLLFNTIYHYFTGSSTEFTRISPECCQNTELEHLKTGDNHNSAFPPGLHLGSKASLQKGVLAGGPRTAHRFGRGSSGLPRRSTPLRDAPLTRFGATDTSCALAEELGQKVCETRPKSRRPRRRRARRAGRPSPRASGEILYGRVLGGIACLRLRLMRPHVCYVVFAVSRIIILCYMIRQFRSKQESDK